MFAVDTLVWEHCILISFWMQVHWQSSNLLSSIMPASDKRTSREFQAVPSLLIFYRRFGEWSVCPRSLLFFMIEDIFLLHFNALDSLSLSQPTSTKKLQRSRSVRKVRMSQDSSCAMLHRSDIDTWRLCCLSGETCYFSYDVVQHKNYRLHSGLLIQSSLSSN